MTGLILMKTVTHSLMGARRWLATLLAGLLLLTACGSPPISSSSSASMLVTVAPLCQSALPQAWTPVGKVWMLSVIGLVSSRAPQTEHVLMTFAEDGAVTATFPDQLDGFGGSWCMTGPDGFVYHFKEPLISPQGTRIGYVAVDSTAYLTDATHFVAVGKGMAYTMTGVPIPRQASLSQAQAQAV